MGANIQHTVLAVKSASAVYFRGGWEGEENVGMRSAVLSSLFGMGSKGSTRVMGKS